MRNIEIEVLNKETEKFITALAPLQTLGQSFVFVYKNQKPNVALFLKSGKVLINGELVTISKKSLGVILVLEEFLNRDFCSKEVKVIKGSRISVIDRQKAQEIAEFINP